MPFFLERIDYTLSHHGAYLGVGHLKKKPSEYVEGHIYGCLVDDLIGLQTRDRLVTSQLMFEVDFPHGDSHWPNSLATFERLAKAAELTVAEAHGIVRNNAIECYGLERFGIHKSTPAPAASPLDRGATEDGAAGEPTTELFGGGADNLSATAKPSG